jgi:hypothetical protein
VKNGFYFVCLVAVVALSSAWLPLRAVAQAAPRAFISFADARPVFETLRPELLPPDLRGLAAAQREASWPSWVEHRDAEIRSRIGAGDEDSIVNFLLYGTTFTGRPRATDADIATLVTRPAEAPAWLRGRADDFAAALASPGVNERLQFARAVISRHRIDPATASGKTEARQFLEQRAIEMSASGALRTRALLDTASTELSDRLTVFRERGLSSDTSIYIDFGIDAALEAIRGKGALAAGSVKRIAIVGPGLDFSDKLDGYDFYPPQTIQPFAVVDSLMRLGLASRTGVEVTAFDLSPRILQHVEGARARARMGEPYALVLPRNLDQAWSTPLVAYWQRVGDRIGDKAPAVQPPANAGRAEVRRLLVRPSIVQSIGARDLDIVLQHPEPAAADAPFDLMIATNILLYYDVFEQSLAGINIAKMVRPGGLLLTNNRIFELPSTPLTGIGFTDVSYISLPGIGNTGDRIIWYQRQ